MEKEQQQTAQSAGLIYGLNDRPPLKDSIFAALQHLLAIFVAIITPPLIIAGALKLDLETTGFLVSMALFASGISTFIQCRRRTDRLWTAVYSGNQLLIHWSDYFCGLNRWTKCYFRGLYCSFFGGDVN